MSDFLEGVEPEVSATALGQVMAQANKLIEVREKIAEKTAELEDLNKVERSLSRDIVPNLLLQHGITKIGLDNGSTLEVTEELEVGVPKEPENKKKVLAWLSSHGAGELIKNAITFEDPDEEIRQVLADKGFVFEEDSKVNANSLKAWFRGALGMKKNTVAKISVADVPKEANLFLYKKTSIK